MTATLAQQAALAVDTAWRARVRAAMIAGAGAILAFGYTPGIPETYRRRADLATSVMQDAASFIDQFSWALVQDPNVNTNYATSLTGIASTAAGPPLTVTTSAPHGLSTGATVQITGAVDPAANGWWTITVTTTTAFTIPVAGTAAGTAGGMVVTGPSDAQVFTAVASVWSDLAGVHSNTI